MAENQPPATAAAAAADIPGQPFYEKTRAHLHALLWKRKELERSLAAQEEAIYKKETEYLEETPGGNIIVGFDGYTKGGSGGGGGRRRVGTGGEMRVFSRSSLSWNANAVCISMGDGMGWGGEGSGSGIQGEKADFL